MPSQRRLRLRQCGKHHGNPRPWILRFGVNRNLAMAFECNVWPRHYRDDEPPPVYQQMHYVQGVRRTVFR